MSNVAHMPAHKALNIDNFHDATVKVGMYEAPVTAFMHPYTLGALETSIRKTGGTLLQTGRFLSYRGVMLFPTEFWSKDDVTFCVVPTAGLKDALARGAVTVDGWQAHVRATRPEAEQDDIAQRMVEIEAEAVNDVTGELEISKAKAPSCTVRTPGSSAQWISKSGC